MRNQHHGAIPDGNACDTPCKVKSCDIVSKPSGTRSQDLGGSGPDSKDTKFSKRLGSCGIAMAPFYSESRGALKRLDWMILGVDVGFHKSRHGFDQ